MKTSEVLKHAKLYLAANHQDSYSECNKEQFICIAIMVAASHTKRITEYDVERCRLMIESRLAGNDTLEGWLVHKGCLTTDNWTHADKDRIQEHRHAWLDMMITEFEAKGD